MSQYGDVLVMHFPFGMSLEHAPIHRRSYIILMAPRIDPLIEWRLLFAQAEVELNIVPNGDEEECGRLAAKLRNATSIRQRTCKQP